MEFPWSKKKPSKVLIDVCTDDQKELLEKVAAWNEKEDEWNPDAALAHLFFRGWNIFDPPDCPSFVKISHSQLLNLRERVSEFLHTADEMGFSAEVREGLKKLDEEVSYFKSGFKEKVLGYSKMVGSALLFTFGFFFLTPMTFSKSFLFGLLLYGVIDAGKTVSKGLLKVFRREMDSRFSKILRKIKSDEIGEYLKWAEEHLKAHNLI